MITKVFPGKCLGSVHIPPSKSMAHRSIICAALAKGKSRIDNVSYSQDILTTIEGMRALGAKITTYEDAIEVEGINDFQHLMQTDIFCNESGSTLRFFIPIFSLSNQKITFRGKGRLMERPQTVYQELFQQRGLSFEQQDGTITIEGALTSGTYTLAGDVSSQFISGLLFTLPLCDGPSTIIVQAPFESRSYVLLTMQMLQRFGIETTFLDEHTIYIKGNQQYLPGKYAIEGDYSQLAFFACLAACNHDLRITGVHHDSQQGDKVIMDILKQANVSYELIEHGYLVHKSEVKGCEIDLADCPDLGPILCVLAAFAQGETHIKHAERLRIKESDRIAAMEAELSKLGVRISSTNGDIYIQGAPTYPGSMELDGHNDHRIVMSMAVAATLCEKESWIHGSEAINKSYPQFFDDLCGCGIEVESYE